MESDNTDENGGVRMNPDLFTASAVMHSIVPITRFNRGEASKIFDEVAENGFKVVVKNNKPACVLLSPERYDEIMELLSDQLLFREAEKRMENADDSELLKHEEVMKELGITADDLADIDVEIE